LSRLLCPDNGSKAEQVREIILQEIENENKLHRTCANKLYDVILQRNIKSESLELMTGLSPRTISRMAKYGYRADTYTLVRVAKAVGWSLDNLQEQLALDGKSRMIGYTAIDRAYKYYLTHDDLDWAQLAELKKLIEINVR